MDNPEEDGGMACLRFIILIGAGLAAIISVVMALGGCVSPESYVQVGDTLYEAVEKQGPIVGVYDETAKEGETWVALSGGFVVAVFNRKDWDLYHGSTVELRAGECVSTGEPRVRRVDLDWRALPSAER